jgi:predicted HicB family RNase H-like nuclease
MASVIAPFGIRLPPELKQWLGQQALSNRRSLNSEMIKRLEDSRKREMGEENGKAE